MAVTKASWMNVIHKSAEFCRVAEEVFLFNATLKLTVTLVEFAYNLATYA